MSLLTLPNELILTICASPTLDIPDISCLLQTCRRLATLSESILIRQTLKRRSDQYGQNALHHAVKNYDYKMMESLLDGGILEIISPGKILLNVAIHYMTPDEIDTLGSFEIDANTLDGRGRTPLMCATIGQFPGTVTALLQNPTVDLDRPWLFPDFTAFHLAVWIGDSTIVKAFLDERPAVNVNRVDGVQRTNEETIANDIMSGCLPNHLTEKLPAGFFRSLHLPDFLPSSEFTSYHHCIFDVYNYRVRMLRDREVTMDSDGEMESIVLETIQQDMNFWIDPTFLGDTIAKVKTPLRRGWAPLHGSVAQHDCRILRILLGHPGINTNVLSNDMETPLWTAVRLGNLFAIRLLLAREEVEIHLAGESVLHFAVVRAPKSVIEILLADGRVNVNCVDGNGRSALHIAASIGRMDVILLLLAHHDTEIEMLDRRGLTARELALPDFPEAAWCLTLVQIAERTRVEYLDLACPSYRYYQ